MRVVREELTWRISAESGPTMCMPTTLSEPVSTTIFMKPLPSDPEMVFFMGLQCRMSWMMQ